MLKQTSIPTHYSLQPANSGTGIFDTAIMLVLNRLVARFGLRIYKRADNEHVEIEHDKFVIGLRPAFVKELLKSLFYVNPDVMVGEGYMYGDWWVENGSLEDIIAVFYKIFETGPFSVVGSKARKLRFNRVQKNNPVSSRKNIAAHYDAWNNNNDLFKAMLGDTMSYSSAIYDPQVTDEPLDAAQGRKIELICSMVKPSRGQTIIDIGCGWGLLTRKFANCGANVIGITLSREQLAWCVDNQTSPNEGYVLEDYREHFGRISYKYDHAVCLEVLDHIGVKQLANFFSTVFNALAPGGRFTLQLITRPRAGITTKWIDKYIYPGGYIASYNEVSSAFRRSGFIEVDRCEYSGLHYARTLEAWRRGLQSEWPTLSDKYGFTMSDYRMWMFFFAGSISVFRDAGFRTVQLQLARP